MDSAEIREALRKRLDDPFGEVRDEAVWGLAKRRDSQGLRLLVDRLEAQEWVTGDEMAAAEALDFGYDTPIEKLLGGLRNLLSGQGSESDNHPAR